MQEEHRNLQALYVKEREKNDKLRKIVEILVSICPVPRSTCTSKPLCCMLFQRAENQELKNAKENKDRR